MEPQEIACTIYQECPALLSEGMRREAGEMRVASHLLKSNCKITGQPDWGSIYIRLKGACLPDEKALLLLHCFPATTKTTSMKKSAR